MITELDAFSVWINNEVIANRIKRVDGDRIIGAIDIVENAIEEYKYLGDCYE